MRCAIWPDCHRGNSALAAGIQRVGLSGSSPSSAAAIDSSSSTSCCSWIRAASSTPRSVRSCTSCSCRTSSCFVVSEMRATPTIRPTRHQVAEAAGRGPASNALGTTDRRRRPEDRGDVDCAVTMFPGPGVDPKCQQIFAVGQADGRRRILLSPMVVELDESLVGLAGQQHAHLSSPQRRRRVYAHLRPQCGDG